VSSAGRRATSDPGRTRLAVLGSPIAHSKSPAIQAAAYRVLGLDWSYQAVDVAEDALAQYLQHRDSTWRGLSLTMPLKRRVVPLLRSADELVGLIGSANTIRLDDDGLHGYNTDVYGVTQTLRDAGVERVRLVHILGGGATAASVIAAVAELGAERVLVRARTPERAAPLVELGERLGLAVSARAMAVEDRSLIVPDLIVSTLPGGAAPGITFPEAVREGALLFDVAYDPWPSELAAAWEAVGGRVASGLDMLIHQAVGQIRIWVHGDQRVPLPDETDVLTAMRAAVSEVRE
jgi:shikimate dehydrogenase